MTAFTPREAARDSFASARGMGTARVLGADPAAIYEARRSTWQRVLARVNAAVGTPRTFIREPDDQQLERMAALAQGELDRLDAWEAARVQALRTRLERERERELVEPTPMLVGPRRWLQPDGTFR